MDTNLISCSVGILTFNSEKTLQRALESVKDFKNIIISDGGSTDATLAIARKYGCTIIDQYTKHHPGANQFHPIENFARERNLMLDVATEDWFLWIDSDEYISETLHDEIKEICSRDKIDFYAYEIPIGTQSPDATILYKPWKQMYQIRFFNLNTGGRFERVMHERFVFDTKIYPVGRLRGVWYVPLSKPDFLSYSRAVNYRLSVLLSENPPTNFLDFLYKGIHLPLKRSLGAVYRMVMMRLSYASDEVFPLFYYRNQLYSHWVTFRIVTKLYFSKHKD